MIRRMSRLMVHPSVIRFNKMSNRHCSETESTSSRSHALDFSVADVASRTIPLQKIHATQAGPKVAWVNGCFVWATREWWNSIIQYIFEKSSPSMYAYGLLQTLGWDPGNCCYRYVNKAITLNYASDGYYQHYVAWSHVTRWMPVSSSW